MNGQEELEVRALYEQLLAGWNKRSGAAMADAFEEDGEMIGFDGSQIKGRAEITSHLEPIFIHHPTPVFVGKVKAFRLLSPEVADLRAIAGMVPSGQTELQPNLNTHHTVIAVKRDGKWQITLFQNTPAQFHGRPELVQEFTDELRQLLR